MKTLAFMGGMLLLAVGVVMIWQKMYPTYTYRFRLTVEIDTPEGVKSGSSVYEVETKTFPRWVTLGNADNSIRFSGEAVIIDLGNEKRIFAIMDSSFETLAPRVFLNMKRHSVDKVQAAKVLEGMEGEKRILTTEYIPTIVTFEDEGKPSSIVGLYMTKYWDDIETKEINTALEALGDGYKINKTSIEITDELVTREIHQILPWISTQKGSLSRKSDNPKLESIGSVNLSRR